MCYHVLNQRGTVISCSTVQRVTDTKNMTAEVCSEDVKIGDKPNLDHWSDLIENDSDFCEEFERIYNNDEIPEADDKDYTPGFFDNTYLNMEVDFPRYGELLCQTFVRQIWHSNWNSE